MTAVFVRVIGVDGQDHASALKAACAGVRRGEDPKGVYYRDPVDFQGLPSSPFSYWLTEGALSLFAALEPVESDRWTCRQGLSTTDNFRFVRTSWEIKESEGQERWFPFAKGGDFARYYQVIDLMVNWHKAGREIKALIIQKYPYLNGNPDYVAKNTDFYFRPGLTWTRRTSLAMTARALPRDTIFSDAGPAMFPEAVGHAEMTAALGVLNSLPFQRLTELLVAAGDAAARQYDNGLIGRMPFPSLGEVQDDLLDVVMTLWRRMRSLDDEHGSPAFLLPSLMRQRGQRLRDRMSEHVDWIRSVHEEVMGMQQTIDERSFQAFGLSEADRKSFDRGAEGIREAGGRKNGGNAPSSRESDTEISSRSLEEMINDLLEWTVGVTFGRFDIRLATGERPIPEDPDPFDPLPVCSPGMLQDESDFPASEPPSGYPIDVAWDGILVDDAGHPRDVVRSIRSVLHLLSEGHDWPAEAEEILGRSLRDWVGRSLFDDHIKRYSKSRRKAPIFWRLGTPSGSYSVWLYYPRATGDTLYRVLNDYVNPKLRHEESALLRLRQAAGASPTASQQKAIEAQEELVSEVQTMKGELEVLAPLWSPEFDDGVVLNFAPFWRLVAHSRSWQKETKKHWDKLVAGEYDWSHTAMRLWPERVVPACVEDRSFAIAHGLEEEFFRETKEEREGGADRVRESDHIERLVEERTSQAVKQALETLVSR